MNESKINDFINSFSREILEESEVNIGETKTSERLLKEIENRVVARLFLEMIALLTPEQASRITKNINEEDKNLAKLMESMANEIPEFHIHMAKALQKLRGELVEDFKKLVV